MRAREPHATFLGGITDRLKSRNASTPPDLLFPGFALDRIDVGDVALRVRHGGTGPPILLLHGHPRTDTTWPAAPSLTSPWSARIFGDMASHRVADESDHSQASKRAMARDAIELMRSLGHQRFAIVGHDRGAYAALRTALDHPSAVSHLAVLDAVPIGEALTRTDAAFAQMWPHWFLSLTSRSAPSCVTQMPGTATFPRRWAGKTTRTTVARSTTPTRCTPWSRTTERALASTGRRTRSTWLRATG